ncbi:dTMP kinase [Limosilactobacillus fastidiosus]|uniref:Thymidylate kinase n=1 Tax=Limosilactobacillus fastidiosus TaxID=2759855 RepID=A0A7W3TZG9_9LACO|nr:dTMP kinase [Limosilactobacillus fastidiosus]MBB1062936.1 dTMP kinase [Limosilactobacillus fastidiosus]MBB1086153.1 dTMP kinase [Limosilactobacillus fastidiosus]MCD7083782.1 dTMP kinase [Limosilactobacillus fastidiosus]MCD7085068.1 dTMP kinase [Limosilactobacillus fastidiosus]MCD7114580.1 dTMP kinase [Limosilactobacillus fastidiosus]
MTGKFISFEGPDGAGKTSVINTIQANLEKQLGKPQVMYTREPGGNHISEQIRQVLFDDQNTDIDGWTEALLFAAARRQHIVSEIIPGLKKGKVILCDRYVDSSIAYQGAGRHLGEKRIWDVNQFAIDGLLPDLTIYLDVESEIGLRRIAEHRADQVNRLDEEQLSFHKKVRKSFLRLQCENPERIKLIDASQPLAKVIADVKQTIHAKFNDLF